MRRSWERSIFNLKCSFYKAGGLCSLGKDFIYTKQLIPRLEIIISGIHRSLYWMHFSVKSFTTQATERKEKDGGVGVTTTLGLRKKIANAGNKIKQNKNWESDKGWGEENWKTWKFCFLFRESLNKNSQPKFKFMPHFIKQNYFLEMPTQIVVIYLLVKPMLIDPHYCQ